MTHQLMEKNSVENKRVMSPEQMMGLDNFWFGPFSGDIRSFSGGRVLCSWCFKNNKNCYAISQCVCVCVAASGVDCCFCHVDLLDSSHGLLLMALLAGMMLIPINLVTWIAMRRIFGHPQKGGGKDQGSFSPKCP